LGSSAFAATFSSAFVFAGLAFGLASGLVGEGRLQYDASWVAVLCGSILTLIAFLFWLYRQHTKRTARELAFR
jgi:uncharacterized membrane protein